MSTVKADNFTWKTGQATGQSGTNVTGDQIVYGVAKSWANINGTSGSVATRASLNVSSVTRNAQGDYSVNLTNALLDANYSIQISQGVGIQYSWTISLDLNVQASGTEVPPTTASFRWVTLNSAANSNNDGKYFYISINR
jgi:hypothetical protein